MSPLSNQFFVDGEELVLQFAVSALRYLLLEIQFVSIPLLLQVNAARAQADMQTAYRNSVAQGLNLQQLSQTIIHRYNGAPNTDGKCLCLR